MTAQDDVFVEFSFNKPREYVCEIRNMTEYKMSILLNKEMGEGHSDLEFDILGDRNDTIRNVYYGLMKDVNNQKQMLFLDPGQSYTISYKFRFPERFINARIFLNYAVRSAIPKLKIYEEEFNLREVRNKAYIPQVLREE
jgi:hypothetical protein